VAWPDLKSPTPQKAWSWSAACAVHAAGVLFFRATHLGDAPATAKLQLDRVRFDRPRTPVSSFSAWSPPGALSRQWRSPGKRGRLNPVLRVSNIATLATQHPECSVGRGCQDPPSKATCLTGDSLPSLDAGRDRGRRSPLAAGRRRASARPHDRISFPIRKVGGNEAPLIAGRES